MKNRCQLLLVGLILSNFFCLSQQKLDSGEIVKGSIGQRMEDIFMPHIKAVITSYDLPGITVGVVKDNELVYAKAFGHQNTVKVTPMTIKSVFHMASISKLFVATAIMQLQEQGKLNLDDKIIRHLSYFKIADERYKDITIQQMLSHLSGIPDTNNYEWNNPRYDSKALEDYVKSLFSIKLNSDPGKTFSYSNVAFEVLGDVIAKVSGMSFEDYQSKYILEPLKMNSSTFLKAPDLPLNWASPHMRFSYNKPWDVYPYNRKHAPSSTLHSNIIDMAKFAIANLNKGNLDGIKILKESAYDQLWKPWYDKGDDIYQGLAWSIRSFEEKTIYNHSGSDIGFTTNFVLIPEEGLGIIVLTNVSDAPVNLIAGNIIRVVLNIDLKTHKPSAFVPVTNIYKSEGLRAAVKLWNELKTNHLKEYNFAPDTSSALFYAMFMDDVEETKKLSLLVKEIFPEEVHKVIIEETISYLESAPGSQSATEVLKIFKID